MKKENGPGPVPQIVKEAYGSLPAHAKYWLELDRLKTIAEKVRKDTSES